MTRPSIPVVAAVQGAVLSIQRPGALLSAQDPGSHRTFCRRCTFSRTSAVRCSAHSLSELSPTPPFMSNDHPTINYTISNAFKSVFKLEQLRPEHTSQKVQIQSHHSENQVASAPLWRQRTQCAPSPPWPGRLARGGLGRAHNCTCAKRTEALISGSFQ